MSELDDVERPIVFEDERESAVAKPVPVKPVYPKSQHYLESQRPRPIKWPEDDPQPKSSWLTRAGIVVGLVVGLLAGRGVYVLWRSAQQVTASPTTIQPTTDSPTKSFEVRDAAGNTTFSIDKTTGVVAFSPSLTLSSPGSGGVVFEGATADAKLDTLKKEE